MDFHLYGMFSDLLLYFWTSNRVLRSSVSWNIHQRKTYTLLRSLYHNSHIDVEYVDFIFDIPHDSSFSRSLLVNIVTSKGSLPHMVNASRADPRDFNSQLLPGASCSMVHSADSPVTFFALGPLSTMLDPHSDSAVDGCRKVYTVDIGALAGDWQRSVAFFGQVFRKSEGMGLASLYCIAIADLYFS